MNLAHAIIDQGYKAVLKTQHPDLFPNASRKAQDEICKRLAMERDRLFALAGTCPNCHYSDGSSLTRVSWEEEPCSMCGFKGQLRKEAVSGLPQGPKAADPLQGFDQLIDELGRIIGGEVKRTVRQAMRPRKRQMNKHL
jgi:hypothetical protein